GVRADGGPQHGSVGELRRQPRQQPGGWPGGVPALPVRAEPGDVSRVRPLALLRGGDLPVGGAETAAPRQGDVSGIAPGAAALARGVAPADHPAGRDGVAGLLGAADGADNLSGGAAGHSVLGVVLLPGALLRRLLLRVRAVPADPESPAD